MAKSRFLKLTAAMLIFAMLINTCIAGMFTVTAAEAQTAVTETEEADYIDNSALIPAYLPNDKVTLELSDDGVNYWTPDWVKDLIIVQANPAWSSDGTLSGMTTILEHLAETGVNGLMLTPINEEVSEDGTKSEGNAYSNFGPHTIASALTGTEYGDTEAAMAAVKKFVDKAHSYNIRVFFDVITWGVNYDAPLYDEHPEWFSGEKEAYSGYLFDWENAETSGLFDFFKNAMVDLITATGADGYRADCGASYSGTEIFREVRQTLIDEGFKIAMFSENPSEKDGTFDLDLHSYIDEEYTMFDTNKIYLENNIVDAVMNGTFAGNGRYYTSLVSCHDYTDYAAKGNLIQMGYASIFTPYIPMWYLGEEFNNTRAETAQLYGNPFYWSEIENNRQYFETIKSYIRTRRIYSDSFGYFDADSTYNSIAEVYTDNDTLLPAYARYGEGTAVLVVPNDSDADVKLNVEIPLFNIGLDSSFTYQLKDTVTGKVLISDFTANSIGDATFNVTIKAGEVGVYAIEKVASVNNSWIQYDTALFNWRPVTYVDLRFYLKEDFSIDYTGVANSSYWSCALHQYMSASDDTNNTGYWAKHNALAQMLRENIYVNGISVEDGIARSNLDNVVIAYRESLNAISVLVNQNDNPFGITAGGNANLQIKDGIILDGYAIGDINLEWPYVAEDHYATRYHSTNKIVDADYTDGVITLTAEDRLESFVGKEDVATLIGARIKINNTAVSTDNITVEENQIKIAYSTYDDFDIYVSNGIILNGKEISPARYNVAVEGSAASDTREQGDYVEVADTEGAFTPYYSYFKLTDAAGVGCGDASHHTGNSYVLNFVIQNASDTNSIMATAPSDIPTGFYNSHLCVYTPDAVNPYIIINGKSIAQWLKETGASEWKAVHVRAASANTLQIIIPESNIFGFDITKPFTITFDEGLTLNGKTVNARNFNCPGHDFNATTKKEYGGSYFSKVTKWSTDMVSADNVSAGGNALYLSSATAKNVCNSHGDTEGAVESWLIQIQLDKAVYDKADFGEPYYLNHLQATGGTDVRTDYSTYDVIRQNILINGKNLNELHDLSTNRIDWTTYLHVILTESNVLRIMIPKDNTYGFNGDGNFTIQVKDGIELNGIKLNPFIHTHIAGKPVTATITKPTITVNSSAYALEGGYHKIRIYDNITTPQLKLPDIDTLGKNNLLQNIKGATSDVYKELAVDLCKYIKINGYNIAEGHLKAKHYSSAMIALNNDGRVLQLQIDATNAYNILNTERVTVEVLEGLNINGYEIEPVVYYYDGNGKTATSDSYFASVGKLENGEIIAHSANSLKAGDSFGVEVKAADGYQLKAGTLTYNYWYKGEYVKQPITEFSSADGYYKAVSPDVNGVLMAEFVAVDETANMATLGAKSRTEGTQGIKFVNRLYTDNIDLDNNKITIAGTEYDITAAGSQLAIVDSEGNIDWTTAYEEKLTGELTEDYLEFGPEIVNIYEDLYDVEFASRAYLSYQDADGVTQTVYTEEIIRSVNDLLS